MPHARRQLSPVSGTGTPAPSPLAVPVLSPALGKLSRILFCALVTLGLAAIGTIAPARADDAPAEVGRSYSAVDREREELFENLKAAKNEKEGRQAEDAIWRFWMRNAPNAEIEKGISDAMRRRREADFDSALVLLDDVIAKAPDYAEGYNQRAFIYYLKGRLDRSLEDIDRALEIEPKHFGAMSGKARILMEQGRMMLGQKVLREVIAIHPWIRERSLLLPGPKEERT